LREAAAAHLPDEHAGDFLENGIAALAGGTAWRADDGIVARNQIDLPEQIATEIKNKLAW
jgi:hypothetical protein